MSYLAQKCQKWSFFGPKCCFWAKYHFLEESTKMFDTIMTEHSKGQLIVFTAMHRGFQAAAMADLGPFPWYEGP